ncbi:MAG: ASCH domain-containing protein [Streptococcaceae bacterium]|jgi:uncharacterized protein YhfF|nr:ASCH domain-containing protein [Streptococcaceae bacterium]
MRESDKRFWEQFKSDTGLKDAQFGSAWGFGTTTEMADELGQLVLMGKKTGTSSAVSLYEIDQEPFPTVGKVFDILLDGNERPIAILQNIKVTPFRFEDVTAEMARKEGEGDLSIAYWQKVHRRFFKEEFQKEGLIYDEAHLELIYEEFEVVYS